ncbi:hypothetical protein AUEXF2481DRAFT_31264 [Aureobasidium subglaciale EXF-2481]|uniref:Uncharacterized protein n=1 Tax=Aureobasidium subglaciale (strain EXF-2481) TaxID=1043005 RepID=A0A074YGL0_AURSE|nr:uncharacterized protein AUEXF2481DRAFT_31264 [Aureobasidium subglaciale EXF-2481]KAI5194935.1 hypothetical protein E4T38_09330 [Aureobasidium subglaciale]KAI5214001.1 hypothetical protein E4T40_09281 [Aureobasidium subglaciale]KAI5216386.1 hypothetical protein E4T41_09282 [Aureobasidium subglaciale]KAI5254211.1 hypothetical protein E4T46_09237 [Aureobasidium subglaciale]KEQ93222.1 hypothetical protein AUEXF2481DRAFT_31264 [Aureobasidium subglaciale EXF-2481]
MAKPKSKPRTNSNAKVKVRAPPATKVTPKATVRSASVDEPDTFNTSDAVQPRSQDTHQAVTLLNLPLELLHVIFDYAADRDHLKHHRYTIRMRERETASAPNCRYPFHLRIDTRLMMSNSVGGPMRLQHLEGLLPYPLGLSTIKLTLVIHEISRDGFDFSFPVDLGVELFKRYRTKKLDSEGEVMSMHLSWRLVCIDPLLTPKSGVRRIFDWYLQELMDELHQWAASRAVHNSWSLERFVLWLERWLKTDISFYSTKGTLLGCLHAKTRYDRVLALDHYYEGAY